MSKIEQIASVHLGKASDGSTVKAYVTPNEIDSSLLVAVPRYLNREHYSIIEDSLPFRGQDVWNCYEVSFLLDNGFPANCVAKISYPANSFAIVESKSLKLYLNSFNMHKCGMNVRQALVWVTQRITNDLSGLLDTDVQVSLFADDATVEHPPIDDVFLRIENMVDVDSIEFP